MNGYAGAYNRMQFAPPPFGQTHLGIPGAGSQATPFGMPMPGRLTPTASPQPNMQGGGGGGWLGALGRFTGWGDMTGMERAYMLASVGGGVADYFERQGDKEEEKRRYEEQLEEDRAHRRMMGQNLGRVWGG